MRNSAMRFSILLLMGLLLPPGPAQGQTRVEISRADPEEATILDLQEAATAPAPWIQEDPGSRAYTAAREALNARRYQEAIRAYNRLRDDYPASGYVADSYYYQAFALYRMGSRSQLREARDLLRTQIRDYSSANTVSDAQELLALVQAQLAEQGDAAAAAEITQQATDPCGPDQEIRAAALSALLNMNAERAIPILRQVLEDKDACSAELREQAVFLIAQQEGDDAVDVLLDLAHNNPDPSPEVVEQAVFWLSQVESPRALGALEEILLNNDDSEIQEAAIFAISQQGTSRSSEILREYARRENVDPDLRETAIFWIGQSPDGVEFVKSIWDTLDDSELKESVLHAVAQSDADTDRRWLVDRAMDRNEDMDVRKNALFWAGQAGAFTIQELRSLFDGMDDPEMREQVIFVASQRSETEAVDFLMEIAEDEENGKVREQAIFWLGQSDDPRVPEFLLRIIGR